MNVHWQCPYCESKRIAEIIGVVRHAKRMNRFEFYTEDDLEVIETMKFDFDDLVYCLECNKIFEKGTKTSCLS